MSYSQAQLDALREAAASGTTRVTYDGTTVEYRTLSEILRMIRIVENALAPRGSSHVNPVFRRMG